MKLTDFLGQEYGPGDLVIYAAHSGRSANIVIGRVTDIYRTAYVDFRWKRLADDAPVPHRTNYKDEDMGEADTAIRVLVQGMRGARWTQHPDRRYHVDTRTGKRINPDTSKHILKESHYVFADGTEYDWDGERAKWDAQHAQDMRGWGYRSGHDFEYDHFRKRYHVNYSDRTVGVRNTGTTPAELALQQLWYVRRTYQPWVEERTEGPKPVTLTVTDNIVKWIGELPDAEQGSAGEDAEGTRG